MAVKFRKRTPKAHDTTSQAQVTRKFIQPISCQREWLGPFPGPEFQLCAIEEERSDKFGGVLRGLKKESFVTERDSTLIRDLELTIMSLLHQGRLISVCGEHRDLELTRSPTRSKKNV